MNHIPEQETVIFQSWKRCVRAGLHPDAPEVPYPYTPAQVDMALERTKRYIVAFERCVLKIQNIPRHWSILLCDGNGMLLRIMPERSEHGQVLTGYSFAEHHSGTNAVGLSLDLHRPVYTLPDQNYHSSLARYTVFARPAYLGKERFGIALLSERSKNGEVSKVTVFMILQLIEYVLQLDTSLDAAHSWRGNPKQASLSRRQREVILMIAAGMTDKELASRLGIGLDAVRYHKKQLYTRLHAVSNVDAVVKALQLGVVNLEELAAFA